MTKRLTWASGVPVLFVVLLVVGAAAQNQPEVMQGRQDAVVRPCGDVDFKLVLTPSLAAYTKMKQSNPNPYVTYRMMGPSRAKFDLRDLKLEYDDATHSLKIAGVMAGAAVCRGGSWQLEVEKTDQLLMAAGQKVALTSVIAVPGGPTFKADSVFEMPATATDIHLDADTHSLVYRMAYEKGAGPAEVECTLRVKPSIMAALYKIYGSPDVGFGAQWVGKVSLHNVGKTPIRNLHISYALGEYCDWSVPSEYEVVLPQGTVVDAYYPILPSRVSEIRSETPLELRVKYQYDDANGQTVAKEKAERLKLLGINTFACSNLTSAEDTGTWYDAFSNAPLLAAYVTKNDTPVRIFAGMASQLSGGAGASLSVKDAVKYLEALYELEVANGICYQTSSGLALDTHHLNQEVKYPRDVLRDKSGTCIDLAMTYAAAAEAVGLKTILVLIPGHCYPIIKLPEDGGLLPVECTCVGGAGTAQPFGKALEAAAQELKELPTKDHYLIDVHEVWLQGVPLPELPALPETCLKDWGYTVPNGPMGPQAGGRPQEPGPGMQPGAGGQAGGPFIGVIVVPVPPDAQRDLGMKGGALVQQVAPGGPAEQAGIRPWDILVKMGGKPIAGPEQMVQMVQACQPNTQLPVELWRMGNIVRVTVAVGARPAGLPGQ